MSCSVKKVPTTSFEMKYMRFGREGAAPIVILPGLSVQYVTDSAEAVAAAYGKLAADYDLYLFDRRTDVPEEYGIRQMAEDTAQAMQILGLHQAGIFSVSQGGMIAQALAVRYPQLVSAMVLGSTACRATAQTQDIVCSWIKLAKEEKRDEIEKIPYKTNAAVNDAASAAVFMMSEGIDAAMNKYNRKEEK